MGTHQNKRVARPLYETRLPKNGSTERCGRDPTMSITTIRDFGRQYVVSSLEPTERITLYREGDSIIIGKSHGSNADGHATVERLRNGDVRLTFLRDVYAVIDDRNDSIWRPFHLRTARAFRPGLEIDNLKGWLHLKDGVDRYIGTDEARARCQRVTAKIAAKHLYAWGGSDYCLLYSDEVFIPDYTMSGTTGWALNEEDLHYAFN